MSELCLDLATKWIGFALGRENEYISGHETQYPGGLYCRLDQLVRDVEALRETFNVKTLAVERPVYVPGHGPETFYILAQAVGVVGLWARRHDVRFLTFYPSTVKSKLAGTGSADKAQMIKAARLWTGGEARITGEHHADAVGVLAALYHQMAEERLAEWKEIATWP